MSDEYDDAFAQLGVKSLAELTDRYEGRIQSLQEELHKQKAKRMMSDLALVLSDTRLPTEFEPKLPPIIRLHRYIKRQQWLLEQIVSSLPQNRNWLDPAVEAEARAMIQEKLW